MKLILIIILFILSSTCQGQKTVNCDTCLKKCCDHAPKKPGVKTRSVEKPGISICIDNSHCGNTAPQFAPHDIIPVCIKEKEKERDPAPPNPSAPIWIGVAALFVSLVTSWFSNYISKKNTEKQLKASQENLLKQIEANNNLELRKREQDNIYKLKTELKETCAKFLNAATDLNQKLDEIIYDDIEEGRDEDAWRKYSETKVLRNELKGYYYSLKVMLDGTKEQRGIEKTLDEYMNVTCFEPKLETMSQNSYTQPLGLLFHQAKTIIHANYQAQN